MVIVHHVCSHTELNVATLSASIMASVIYTVVLYTPH